MRGIGLQCGLVVVTLLSIGCTSASQREDAEESASTTQAIGPIHGEDGAVFFGAHSQGTTVRTQSIGVFGNVDQGFLDANAQEGCRATQGGRRIALDTQVESFVRDCRARGGSVAPASADEYPPDTENGRCIGEMKTFPKYLPSTPVNGKTTDVARRLQIQWSILEVVGYRCELPPSDGNDLPIAEHMDCMEQFDDDAPPPPQPTKLAPREGLSGISKMVGGSSLPANLDPKVYVGPDGVFAEEMVVALDCSFPLFERKLVTISDGMGGSQQCWKSVPTGRRETRNVALERFNWEQRFPGLVLYQEGQIVLGPSLTRDMQRAADQKRRDELRADMRKRITTWVSATSCGGGTSSGGGASGGGGMMAF